MVQEGTLGLIETAERFDSTKVARFGTYAIRGILGETKNFKEYC